MKGNDTDKRTLAICFGHFGPYHHARVAALQRAAAEQGVRAVPVQIAGATTTYEWESVHGTAGLRDQKTKRLGGQTTNAVAVPPQAEDLKTLCEGVEETASPLEVFLKARQLFRDEKVDVAFLPSYSPARFFALFAAAKSLGIRTVMMNESHAGTEQATGWKRWIKRQIVKQFDAAFVGGKPHKRHFASLGIPADKIFTGYDAVDNALFAARADEVRKKSDEVRKQPGAEHLSTLISQPSTEQSLRSAYGLPERYFLSLGRMVEKKNLSTLVEAYARFARASVERSKAETGNLKPESPETADGGGAAATNAENCKLKTEHCPPMLVFVGSGELEGALREQARSLGLRVVDRTDVRVEKTGHGFARIDADGSERLAADRTKGNAASSVTRAGCGGPQSQAENCIPNTENSVESDRGAVYFYGFRQIEENPVFYALAEAFVLPSLKEEWGLVVNEAMAAGLPVIVSRTAGCAEDLVPKATASRSSQLAVCGRQDGEEKTTDDCKPLTHDSLEERSNGFVFDPKSSDALCEALRRIADYRTTGLQDDGTSRMAEMGRRSREIVESFSCENFARQALRAAEAANA